ncbi:hypothetical protein NFI96_002510 [Prochilodus magdalenae]|nr:hypothetical protein NFI96_002510 [Prochilodus magdalenae]
MGTLRLYVFLLVVLAVKAEEEPFLGQREVIFELSDLEDEDFFELPKDSLRQKEVLPDISLFHTDVQQSGPPVFGPRSMGPPQIQFPLAQPKPDNVQAICRYSDQRPRYPRESFPLSGFSHLVRQADAVNQLESWYSVCCGQAIEDQKLLLCCAEQAWKKSLSAFCEVEFGIKTSHYYCCKKKGSARWACFEKAAPNQSYETFSLGSWPNIPSTAGDFQFNPTQCQKPGSQIAPRALRATGVLNHYFPPGHPNSGNIGSICTNRKQRRQYLSTCLPRKGYIPKANQVKAIDELEKGFNQCCKQKKGRQACAEKKWKMMVDDFCMTKREADLRLFDCCDKDEAKEQYDCFAAAAPNPDYILNNDTLAVLQARPTLDMFCNMYTTYHTTQRSLEFVLKKFGSKLFMQCCDAMEEKFPACLHTRFENVVDEVCKDETMRLIDICKKNPKERSKYVSKWILRRLADELNYNSRKKCRMLL